MEIVRQGAKVSEWPDGLISLLVMQRYVLRIYSDIKRVMRHAACRFRKKRFCGIGNLNAQFFAHSPTVSRNAYRLYSECSATQQLSVILVACFFIMAFGEDAQENFHLPLRKNAFLVQMHPTFSLHDLSNWAFYSFFSLTDNAKSGYPQPPALVDRPQLHWSQPFESYLQESSLQ